MMEASYSGSGPEMMFNSFTFRAGDKCDQYEDTKYSFRIKLQCNESMAKGTIMTYDPVLLSEDN